MCILTQNGGCTKVDQLIHGTQRTGVEFVDHHVSESLVLDTSHERHPVQWFPRHPRIQLFPAAGREPSLAQGGTAVHHSLDRCERNGWVRTDGYTCVHPSNRSPGNCCPKECRRPVHSACQSPVAHLYLSNPGLEKYKVPIFGPWSVSRLCFNGSLCFFWGDQ